MGSEKAPLLILTAMSSASAAPFDDRWVFPYAGRWPSS
jgi:hypothetical protein